MTSQQQAPAGGFTKRHVSGMLKFLTDDEQRARALEMAVTYRKLFAEKKWESVMVKLQRLVEEDHLRVVGRRRPAQIATTNKSSPTYLQRHSTASSLLFSGNARAPSTPRERWDILLRGGPVTPLSPTPTGNAFAGGGFWEQLTPKTPASQTPVTAIPLYPISPMIPQDLEARAACEHVKNEVDAMARTICANRMDVHSTISDNEDIPRTLVRSKDYLKGAEITLQYHQVDLLSAIDPALPKKLRILADEEGEIFQQYTIKSAFALLDVDAWLQVDEQTLAITTILDAQRELIRMHHNRRKSKDLKLPDRVVQQAWATRILEDAERAVQADGDSSSSNSDSDETKGYTYSNFLRSIKREASSSSDLASTSGGQSCTNLPSLRSSSTNNNSPGLSRNSTFGSQQSSTSPMKLHHSPLQSKGSSRVNSPSLEKRTSAIASSKRLSRIITHFEEKESVPAPQLSPQDRAFRRMGVSHLELDTWAQQLKEMETQQLANRNRILASQASQHPACRSSLRNRNTSAGSVESWKCEGAIKHERKVSVHGAMNSERDGSPPKHETSMWNDSYPLRQSSSISQSSRNSFRPFSSATSRPPSLGLPPPPPGFKYDSTSNASLRDSIRHEQHAGSRSSFVCAGGAQEEDEWNQELKRMESRERIRQLEEMGGYGRGRWSEHGGL